MKFDMNGPEFETFCAQLGKAHSLLQVHELETELSERRADIESIREDRNYYQNRVQHLTNENDDLLRVSGEVHRELSALKAEVLRLQDLLTPNRVERAYSRAFNFFLTGKKIYAIKEVRALLNIGLKDAKDVVEGNFLDANYPNLVTLMKIFINLEKDYASETQCGRLATLVGNLSADQLASILKGTFHNDAAAEAA